MAIETKLLLISVDESQRWQDRPLYEALLVELERQGIASGAAQLDLRNYGEPGPLRSPAGGRPVCVTATDAEEKLLSVVPVLQCMAPGSRIAVLDVNVLHST